MLWGSHSNFDMWTAKHLAQASCTEMTLIWKSLNTFTKLRLLWNMQPSIWNPLYKHTYRRYCYWVMFTIVLSRRLTVNGSFLSIGYILAHSVDEIVKHLNTLGLHPLWRIILNFMHFTYFDIIICDNISTIVYHVRCVDTI